MVATLTAGQWGLVLVFFAGFVAARHHRRPRRLIRRVRYRRRKFTDNQRRELFALYGGRCFYCGVAVHDETDCPIGKCLTSYEADHYIPASKGGPTTVENGRVSCRYHNRMKGDLMPDEFLARARAGR